MRTNVASLINANLADTFVITSTGKVHAKGCRNVGCYAEVSLRDLRLGARPATCCVKHGTDAGAKWDSIGQDILKAGI
jgi:hypothetical protein